jgi:hypothetical protein
MADPVAVVIPARPCEPFLQEAVDSVLRQPEVGALVVATHLDGSPTARLVAQHPDPRIRLVISSGPSAGENLDAGVARTSAKWLAFLDADDRWPDGRITCGLRAVATTPETELVLGYQQAMTADSELLPAVAPAPLLGAALISRAAADRIGRFGADIIAQMRWLLRARELGVPTVELTEVVLHRRGHPGNLSRTQRAELHGAYLGLARERAARQRDSLRMHDG